jgi:hypothetical protein
MEGGDMTQGKDRQLRQADNQLRDEKRNSDSLQVSINELQKQVMTLEEKSRRKELEAQTSRLQSSNDSETLKRLQE